MNCQCGCGRPAPFVRVDGERRPLKYIAGHFDRKAKRDDYAAAYRQRKGGSRQRVGYDKLLKRQGGRCGICRCKPGRNRLCVDHCHKTGRVRGLLCAKCNRGIGLLGDSLEAVTRAVGYLTACPRGQA